MKWHRYGAFYYMFRNYFKTAFRSLRRNKSYTFINVAGLAVGIGACLLLFLVIQYENSFDNFHPGGERIYRISTHFNSPDGTRYSRGTSFPAGKQLPLDYPQLEHVASIYSAQGNQVTILNENSHQPQAKFKEDGLFFAEPQFFDIFNFPFIAGNPKTALSTANTVVLTEETAEKYFGDWRKAIGRLIRYQDNKVCKITGILKNPPVNSDFPLQVAISFKTLNNDTSHDWISVNGALNTFVKLPPGMSAEKFGASLVAFGDKHIPDGYAKKQGFTLQPLSTIHFDKRFGNFNHATFSKELITALSLIGLFLVVIACINFVNLATAQAVDRAKEVGVRKVLGSRKQQLVAQFLSESFIVSLAAVGIAFAIALHGITIFKSVAGDKNCPAYRYGHSDFFNDRDRVGYSIVGSLSGTGTFRIQSHHGIKKQVYEQDGGRDFIKAGTRDPAIHTRAGIDYGHADRSEPDELF